MIGVANAFSGGIFLSVALLHLLPESTEAFHEYFEHNEEEDKKGEHSHFPISFLLAFCGYTVILMIEKIIFDSHTNQDETTIEEPPLEGQEIQLNVMTSEPQLAIPELQITSNKNSNQNLLDPKFKLSGKGSQYFDTSLPSIGEGSPSKYTLNIEMIPNSDQKKPTGGSTSNLVKVPIDKKTHVSKNPSMTLPKKDGMKDYLSTFKEKKKDADKDERKFKEHFSNLGQFSKVAKMKFTKKDQSNRNSRLTHVDGKNLPLIPADDFKQEKNITSYLLILALSIHATFEGIALGLQDKKGDLLYMLLAISFHKWVEALSIGIHLNKSKIERETVLKLIVYFSLMTPVGCILGIFLSGISSMLEATFLSISAGSFIYISASEVIIEEFSVSKYKLEKFVAFLVGAIIICIMTLTEYNH